MGKQPLAVLTDDPTLFPDLDQALIEPNGLLAMGGDLSVERLLQAYQRGIFPWYDENSPILWWSPNPRAVLFLNDLIIQKSLKKILHQHHFSYAADQNFEGVIQACQTRTPHLTPDNPGTWITPELKEAYLKLHHLGHAHSIEIYQNKILVGGLYGVSMGKIFFGESMFHHVSNMSKVALVVLVEQLKRWQFEWIDCQVWSPHLASLGITEIPRNIFKDKLKPYSFELKAHPWVLDKNLL